MVCNRTIKTICFLITLSEPSEITKRQISLFDYHHYLLSHSVCCRKVRWHYTLKSQPTYIANLRRSLTPGTMESAATIQCTSQQTRFHIESSNYREVRALGGSNELLNRSHMLTMSMSPARHKRTTNTRYVWGEEVGHEGEVKSEI